MKKAQLSGSLRSNVGKKDAASIRRAGFVPCVVYGQGTQTHFSVKRTELDKIVYSPEVFQVELDLEGKKVTGIIQELQQHPTKDTIQHVDFLELHDSKPVKVKLPVRITGSARGVLAGGKLMTVFRNLQCVGLPGDLPDAITLDITKLKIGQSIRVNSINIPGVTFLDPANAVVVSVKMARGAVKGADIDDDDEEEA
ncbi:MAG: 50S ribosomal protein L25 [Flavobacteriales bacterium]|jgi:large subunit ribosomal protein L25|nr:50S ribosomal protein L25 [Flavobacteriales bacterium]NCA19940.1 50S ribosomal protein L25 [Crocinitomicaceae bacterium]